MSSIPRGVPEANSVPESGDVDDRLRPGRRGVLGEIRVLEMVDDADPESPQRRDGVIAEWADHHPFRAT